jgi:type I restriction enzyme S subunit
MSGEHLEIGGMLRTSREIAANYTRSTIRFGDIVCAIRATVGKVLAVPAELDGANLTQGTARIAPRDSIETDYLLWALRSPIVQKQIQSKTKGTTFPEITLGDLRKVLAPIPDSREEQLGIAALMTEAERKISFEAATLSKLHLLKSGLYSDLITGRVRVPSNLDRL